jgi:DNA-binding NtrC family response regulator
MKRKVSILIVDDNINLCKILSSILTHKGYWITIAKNGVEAIQLIKNNHFHIMLMDVRMPLVDGIDTYLSIKEMGYDIQTILMTAYTTEDRIKQYMNSGIYGIIFKPVDINMILELIEEISQSNRNRFPDNNFSVREKENKLLFKAQEEEGKI